MQTGIFDKTRLMANILMVILVCLNIWFSIQYTRGIQTEGMAEAQEQVRLEERIKTANFIKLFIDKVLGTEGTIAFEDRIRLEADIRSLEDPAITAQWELFVASTNSEGAQESAVKLMSLLAGKMI